MGIGFRTVFASALLLLLPIGARADSLPGLDCGAGPMNGVESAICEGWGGGSLHVSYADYMKVRSAYDALARAVPGAERRPLAADQRTWVLALYADCNAPTQDAMVPCIAVESARRRDFLVGQMPGSPSGAPRLHYATATRHNDVPGKGGIAFLVSFPQIVRPGNPAQRAFNLAARDIALGTKVGTIGAVPAAQVQFGKGALWADYTVAYLDRRLAAIVYDINDDYGPSHRSLMFDLATGAPVGLSDILAQPKAAEAAIRAECAKQIMAIEWARPKAVAAGGKLVDDPQLAVAVGMASQWAPDATGVDILFDPDTISPNYEGPLVCRLDYARLKPWLKPGGPLPPHHGG